MQQTAFRQCFNDTTIELHLGDIAEERVDAIVAAADEHLNFTGDGAAALRRKAGASIEQACASIGYCPSGHAVLTAAGALNARYLIHAVGPRMGEGDEEQKLVSLAQECLTLARERGLASIALPAIGTGAFGFEAHRAAHLLLTTCVRHASSAAALKRIVFVLGEPAAYDVFVGALNDLYQASRRRGGPGS
ncbi:MAG: macro domain-containing protein [Planctomycetota bacterium]